MAIQKLLQLQWLNIFIPLYYKGCTYNYNQKKGEKQ